MILSTLTAIALSTCSAKTVLGICRDDGLRESIGRIRKGIADTVHTAGQELASAVDRARERRAADSIVRGEITKIATALEQATDDEKQLIVRVIGREPTTE